MGSHLLVLFLIFLASAHICILTPPQRGPLSISQPGDDSCYRRTDYCGGIPFAGMTTPYFASSTTTFLFQQNLNHWYQAQPGFFDVSLTYNTQTPGDKDWILLHKLDDYPAHEQVTQTNFSFPITFPATTGRAILRLRYHSNNPDETSHNTTVFYNCADIQLVQPPSSQEVTIQATETVKAEEKRTVKSTTAPPFTCTSPHNFRAEAFENNGVGRVEHTVYYDAKNTMIRWDKRGELETSGVMQSLVLINNYTAMIEYVIDPVAKTCDKFGPDAFYPWSYGFAGMDFIGAWNEGEKQIAEWFNPTNRFRWQARITGAASCEPYALYTPNSATNFWSVKADKALPVDFQLPSYCNTAQAKKSCSGAGKRFATSE